ncbi:MAG: hypothetical protein ACKPFF_14330 [Planktothrix sp.]
MKTINFNQTSLILYSAEEWLNKGYKMLGGYNRTFGEWNIHILSSQKELEKVYINLFGKPLPPRIKWEHILIHEYVHYLQHAKGCWDEMEPLGLGSIPLTKKFKGLYNSSKWAIEAEAYWVQKHPHLIKWKPPNI